MKGGSEAIQALRKEADGLGLTLDTKTSKSAERTKDAFGRLSASAKGVSVQLLEVLAPTLESVATFLAEGLPRAAQFAIDAFNDLQIFIAKSGSFITSELGGLSRRFAEVADFFGADKVGSALRASGNNYLESAAIFEKVAVRIGKAKDIIFEPPKQTGASFADVFSPGGSLASTQPAKAAIKAANDFNKALQRLTDQLDPTAAKTREYLESVRLLDEAWKRGLISGARYDELFAILSTDAEELAEAQRKLAAEEARAFDLIKSIDPGSIYRDQIIEVQKLRDTFPELSDSLAEVEFELQQQWDNIGGQVEEAATKAKDAWQDLGPVFSSAFEDAIVEGEKLSNVLAALEKDLLRIATRKLITEPLGNAASSFFSSQGGGGNILSSLFGFAAGGSFTVGGQGGTDSQVVAFRATPGEKVEVSRPTADRSQSVVNNFSFVLPSDAASNRRTGEQVAREAARYMSLAQAAT